MKLFLASEAKNPPTIKKLEEYIGGWKGKRIAYIPTAANAEILGWESWRLGGSWNLVQHLGAEVTLVQLEDYKDVTAVDLIRGSNIIWFAGGYCAYLLYWIRRTQLDKFLPEMMNQGSIYVGSSAGSMITSKTLETAEWEFADPEYGASLVPGLGLVDFDIFPHYEEIQLEQIKKHYKGNKLYLVKNGEELIVEDGKVTVVGEERIISRA